MTNRLWKGMLAAAISLPLLGGAAAHEQGVKGRQGIEGVWDVRITVISCTTEQALFSGRAILLYGEGGSVTGITDNFMHSSQLGTWRHVRGQSYTSVGRFFIFNANGSFSGSEEITADIELSTNANEYTDTATTQVFNASDQVISTGCATATATRLE
jgi:hypothetical protein